MSLNHLSHSYGSLKYNIRQMYYTAELWSIYPSAW